MLDVVHNSRVQWHGLAGINYMVDEEQLKSLTATKLSFKVVGRDILSLGLG
jgi:hypothetical protein